MLIKQADGQVYLDGQALASHDFLTALDQQWQKTAHTDSLPLPFAGGWFLYLSYELAGEVEPSLGFEQYDQDLPVAFASRIPAAIIVDHHMQITHLVAEQDYADCLSQMEQDLIQAATTTMPMVDATLQLDEEPGEHYLSAVNKVLDYITEGDVFQVNLSRAWQAKSEKNFAVHPLYRALRRSNPAPFAGYMKHQDAHLLSSSPERLVKVTQQRVDTRPIAGTRPRGNDAAQDTQLQKVLLDNLKERAEHIMLIDLERNDLGRICQPGSIDVDELMILESYAHVHHIVSNVTGRLKTNTTPGQVIRAVFPGGTITGCPKVRCMEIIHELEQQARGFYTGSMGYLNHNGDLDLNILIRSMLVKDTQLQFRAGAGLVADSIAEQELAETRAKAKGLLLALGLNEVVLS